MFLLLLFVVSGLLFVVCCLMFVVRLAVVVVVCYCFCFFVVFGVVDGGSSVVVIDADVNVALVLAGAVLVETHFRTQ